ncbi:MAG TPA: RDD family protein [Gammaproteobacteria bacterium]|nr:RDD family protein [Gammaproteobacteria bacterium]
MDNPGSDNSAAVAQVAGLGRRLGALLYDSLLLVAVLLLAGLPLPLIPESVQHQWPIQLLIRGYLLLVSFVFFARFWTHSGQTLGMRTWHLFMITSQGQPPGWGRALLRFMTAPIALLPLFLGLVWLVWDEQGLAWHDHWSGTRIVHRADQATLRNMNKASTLNTSVGKAAASKGGTP